MKAQSKVKCIGMIFWKQATVRPVLRQHTNRLVFVPSLAKLNRMPLAADAKLVTWGSRDLTQAQQLAQQKNSAAAPEWFNNKKRKATALWQLLCS